MIEIKNLTKKFNEIIAVNNISFKAKKGEIIGFLGPNGAGKTTTLKMMTNFLIPDQGKVLFKNKPISKNFKKIISNIGYLPEDNPLYSNQKVDEFLLFFAKLKNINIKKDSNSIKQIIKKCGLEDVLTSKIDNLSKGYKQRVGLAKALLGDPDYLILDEPTTGLDPNQKQEILDLIRQSSKNKTTIFSSHILPEVKEIANKIIIINKGEIVAKGKPENLSKKFFENALITVKVNAPKTKFIHSIENINTVKEIKETQEFDKTFKTFKKYEIICEKNQETSLKIFNNIVKNKWELLEMYSRKQGLEDLFKKLTQ